MGPFIMNPEGVARFFARDEMNEGPFPEHYEPFETPLGYNPLHPQNAQATSNPAARVFPDDRAAFGKAPEFPHTATTYRLTEHFHFWTKHARLNSIIQPQQFVEIGEDLAKEVGVVAGDRVKVSSNRGYLIAVAVVTKRIKPLMIDGKKVQTVGIPMHWGFKGQTKPGYLSNTLTPVVGDGEFADTGIQVVPGEGREGLGRLDGTAIIGYQAPLGHDGAATGCARACDRQVAKLIDVSKCIGCKACQMACMEWNDLRDEVGINARRVRQPVGSHRAFVDGDALLRVRKPEWQPRMADPQGWLHALRGSGLPEGVSIAGRDRAVHERHRGFP